MNDLGRENSNLEPKAIKGRHTKWYILTFPVSLDASEDP